MATELTVQSERAFQKVKVTTSGKSRGYRKKVFISHLTVLKRQRIAKRYTDKPLQTVTNHQQPHIFTNPKAKAQKKAKRWVKEVGLGFKTPRSAIEGSYIDKKCPFVGEVSIRGKILTGTVVSTKMHRTIIIRRDYLHYVPKYNRYEKRHKNVAAHVSPAFRVQEGDVVVVGQCRPLSKTVRFNVLKVSVSAAKAKKFAKF